MNFGFNSNVRVGSTTYHVQTEDRGPSRPFLDTVVYLSGRVVYKRSTGYEEFAKGMEAAALSDEVRERLSQQHRQVIADLEAGTLPASSDAGAPLPATAGELPDTLDLRLTNPGSWFAAGTVTLKIELREGKSKQGLPDADIQAFLEIGKQRIPCAEGSTDALGSATLQFPIPPDTADGASLVVRATDGARYGELRFRLKAKPRDKTPAPVPR